MRRRRPLSPLWAAVPLAGLVAASVVAARAQSQSPRIAALFPAGARTGETVEVSVKGGNLAGAKSVLVAGPPGVSAELVGGVQAIDEGARPLFQSKCTSCHEARSPVNRSMTPGDWALTVERMIKSRGAEINDADKARIIGYLQALAKAGELGVRVSVAKDAAPGTRELRILTGQGASTAFSFDVGAAPEMLVAPDNEKPEAAQKLSPPVVVNGRLTKSGQRHCFTFAAKKGERFTLGLRAFRLNEQSVAFFHPALYVYDAAGREAARDTGDAGVDPEIDFVAPADGTYTLAVRDLLWKGSPSSVYRLEVRPAPAAEPPTAPDPSAAVLLARDLPDGGGPVKAAFTPTPVALPASFRGRVGEPGATDRFRVQTTRGGTALEIWARRLGSPLRARVTITDAKGNVVTRRDAAGGYDLRVGNAFPSPGEYTVTISDADGGGGPAYVYRWEAREGVPDLRLTVSPDALNLPPGTTSALLVRALRRDGRTAPVALRVEGLPPGVTAHGPALLLPDTETAVIAVTAAPGIAPAVGQLRVEGTTETITRPARPLELYRQGGSLRRTERAAAVVAVTGESGPPFTLSAVDGGAVALKIGGEATLTVRVSRSAEFKGEVHLELLGLPPGVSVAERAFIPADKTEARITLRADGNARYLKTKSAPDALLRFVVGGYIPGGPFFTDGAPVAATTPIALLPEPEAGAK